MQPVSYYLLQAERAERLAQLIDDERAKEELIRMAEDYRDIAQDIESGAIEIRHPERLPQSEHKR